MTELQDAAARALITGRDAGGLDRTLFVEAGAGSGKTTALVARVVALVASGVPMTQIAAITFTEKAAAELRHRLRTTFAAGPAEDATAEERARYREALDDLDAAPVGTLHAFAARLLSEHAVDAGLPPNVEVLDAVASEIAFEDRWVRDRAELLEDESLADVVLLADAMGLPLSGVAGKVTLKSLMVALTDNWDRLVAPASVDWSPDELALPDLDGIRDTFAAASVWLAEAVDTCASPDDTMVRVLVDEVLPYLGRIVDAPDELAVVALLGWQKPSLAVKNKGRKALWTSPSKDDVVERVTELKELRKQTLEDLGTAVVRRLAVAFRARVLAAAKEREAAGRLEFHDLLVLARGMLAGPGGHEIRRSLRRRYTRLLLDEFQDTDPIQLELAELLATDPDTGALDPERLFFVGDPKQSIYRFRRADIGLYLRAAERYATVAPVELTTNFRSTPTLLTWINAVFGELITATQDMQPSYVPLEPAPTATDPPGGPGVAVLGATPLEGPVTASELRHVEATQVADAVHAALTEGWPVRDLATGEWRPARADDITVLLPARTSLSMLEGALEDRRIPYRADTSSLVYATRAIRDLMMTVRAIADPSDELAVVSALRSTVFGCGDDDLVRWRRGHDGRFDPTNPRGSGAPDDDPVKVALTRLGDWQRRTVFLTPSALLQEIVESQRLAELGLLDRRPRDLWRRLRFVVDQARQWSETTGGTIVEYLDWAKLQASDAVRVAESILPETDDVAVRLMTVHASKGLEFPITVLSGLTTRMTHPARGPRVLWHDERIAVRAKSSLSTPEFDALQPIDEQMDHEERLRLLYVACTRARDHLVVSLVRKDTSGSVKTSAEALAACLDVATQVAWPMVGDGDDLPPLTVTVDDPPAPFDLASWTSARQALRPRMDALTGISPTEIQRRLQATATVDDDLAAGEDKEGRDLGLPPWLKGRYGTAFGRAVHGVLQTIDLATGEDLDDIVRAQAVAEGVIDRQPEIAALVRAALDSPVVQEAVASGRVWRETSVATPIGDQVVEGFIDLLFRRGDVVVVVDHKTAGRMDDAELDRRTRHYAPQGAAYALAVERTTGRRVDEVVLLYLGDGRAVARSIPDLAVEQQRVLDHLRESTAATA